MTKNIIKKLAIIVSKFNFQITKKMLQEALKEANNAGLLEENIYIKKVPGTIELSYAAHLIAKTKKFDAIILIGCVIKGETDHYKYVSMQVSYGIQNAINKYNIPIIFNILTTNNKEQALKRINGKYSIQAAINMVKLKQDILNGI